MDLVTGMLIRFSEAVFTGSYPHAQFSHERGIVALIVKESYGAEKGQHTFTLQVVSCSDDSLSAFSQIRRKGRNVYKSVNILSSPDNAKELAEEKHGRGKCARAKRCSPFGVGIPYY